MKYLCMIYLDDKRVAALSASELATLERECADYDAALRKRGGGYLGAALKPVETATTVRMGNGGPSITDGPFAETKEHLGGFIYVDAANLDEAIAIAAKVPGLRLGCVEIRAAVGSG